MNRKQLLLLLVILVVIGGAGLFLVQRNRESWTASDSEIGQKLLKNFQMNDVAAVHIKGDSDLTLAREDKGWCVEQRGNYPANYSQISGMIIKMGDLKVIQSDPIGASQLGRMHLEQPGKGADSATLLEFKDSQGKTLQSLLVGKKHTHESERPSPMPYGDEGFPDGRYVMLTSDPKTVLTISDPLTDVDSKPADWLNKDFFKIEKPRSIAFTSTNAADSWTLTRESESAPWVLASAKPGEVLDTNKVSSVASTFSYPNFVDVAPPGATNTGMDKPETVAIETFDHLDYTLKIGHKTPENDYDISLAVAGDFPTARTPGKDEKPDVKAKLDKEFQDKTKQLQDKLKKEQALAGWTYVVNSWLVDPLIRDRSQLMVEKKTEKKAEGAKTETKSGADDSISDIIPAIPK